MSARRTNTPNHTVPGYSTPFAESQLEQIGPTSEVDWHDGSIQYVIEWKVTLNHQNLAVTAFITGVLSSRESCKLAPLPLHA